MISVRSATINDFQLLADLGRKAFYEAFGKYNDAGDMQTYLDLAFNPDNIKQQLLSDKTVYLIASYHNEPVGYAKLNKDSNYEALKDNRQVQLERIYALGAYVGKKIGKALIEACIQISIKDNFHYIWLSVWQQNKRAIDFYKKWNFEIIGYKKFMIGKVVNDDYVMALDLGKYTKSRSR